MISMDTLAEGYYASVNKWEFYDEDEAEKADLIRRISNEVNLLEIEDLEALRCAEKRIAVLEEIVSEAGIECEVDLQPYYDGIDEAKKALRAELMN